MVCKSPKTHENSGSARGQQGVFEDSCALNTALFEEAPGWEGAARKCGRVLFEDKPHAVILCSPNGVPFSQLRTDIKWIVNNCIDRFFGGALADWGWPLFVEVSGPYHHHDMHKPTRLSRSWGGSMDATILAQYGFEQGVQN
jgi:hypothetical protein